MRGCECDFEYYNAADPQDCYEGEFHAKYHGCTCFWDEWGRIEENRANCPFHKVMY